MPRLLVGTLCVLSLLLLVAPVLAAPRDPLAVELPELEIIPGASWFWVGKQMALDGMPMSIKEFSYSGKPEDVIQFYLSTWKSKGHGKFRNDTLGRRKILGFELQGFFYSVQFESKGNQVQGKAVVTPTPSHYRKSRKTVLPVPPRSEVISKVESLDVGRREETLSISSRFDVAYVADFYKDQLLSDGWFLQSGQGDRTSSASLNFQRGAELLQLTVRGLQQGNSKGCQVLIHWLK